MCNTNQEKKRRFGFGGIAAPMRFCRNDDRQALFCRRFRPGPGGRCHVAVELAHAGVLGAAAITYWQAFGLMILARLVLGTLGMGWKRPHWHAANTVGDRFEHYRNMCGDMGRQIGSRQTGVDNTMKWWHNYKRFWHDEGKAAFDAYMKRARRESRRARRTRNNDGP